MYHSITFTGPYTTMKPTLHFTPTTVVQSVDNHSWGLYCRRCYCIRVCWGGSSRIFHCSRWLGQLSTVLTKDESPHTGYIFTPWVVSFTPPRARSLGRRDLDFTSHPNDVIILQQWFVTGWLSNLQYKVTNPCNQHAFKIDIICNIPMMKSSDDWLCRVV